MFGELIDAKVLVSGKVRVPTAGSQWLTGVYLGKDTEADEVIIWECEWCLQAWLCEDKSTFSAMECAGCRKNDIRTLAAAWRWS